MTRQGRWIDVYPFSGRNLIMTDNKARVTLNRELSDYCSELWVPRAQEGWKSSWVAFADKVSFSDDSVKVDAGAMRYHVINGVITSIEEGKDFAPKQRCINSLSVGFLTTTKDAKIIFQRRPPNVHYPNTLIHEPCGYMASRNFLSEESNPEDEEYAHDPRLFSLETQLNSRKNEIAETFGLSPEQVNYDLAQDFLGAGWRTLEMYFSTTGKINAEQKDLKLLKGKEFVFVPFENVKELIHNQGKLSQLSQADLVGYRPESPQDIPLLDESLVGLMWGYEKITGEKLDVRETVDRLNRDGLSIMIHDTSLERAYKFPTEF
ncbi:hypothetical protein HYT25_01740 [Candidatus Pacearchaeota archaeon]|nr:hypothetical protein [Candidatus Pacearchaeota archaeon]